MVTRLALSRETRNRSVRCCSIVAHRVNEVVDTWIVTAMQSDDATRIGVRTMVCVATSDERCCCVGSADRAGEREARSLHGVPGFSGA